ncbi:E2F-associated phosphoprotein [Egretta garzetta]|nr:E2F-associated phosphoprotein [Egretta garzetta]
MEAELNATMRTMEGKWKSPEMGTSSSTEQTGPATTSKYYDDIYFDSDSEDEDKTATQDVQKTRKHQQRRILSNDELLYDPEEDNRDQEWVDSQRRGYRNRRRAQPQQQTKPSAVPNSDAVLNCPACMTTLCLDCQRHESYKTQYRAMFVMNCFVNKEEILKYRKKLKKRGKKMKRGEETIQSNQEEEEVYHPVLCTECSTEVAVMDKDEVFHFFNVLASHS